MWLGIATALAGGWQPVWSAQIPRSAMPQVELLGTDPAGHTAWLRIADGRSTRALWQVDLQAGQTDARWTADAEGSASYGALAPLIGTPDALSRWGILQSYMAGRPTWPALAIGADGAWFAWEHGTAAGGDGVTAAGPGGEIPLGADDLFAVYRPRFHPTAPLVAYTGATARGEYRVVVQHLDTGATAVVDGVGHASHLDWDAAGALWVVGEGCVRVVRTPPEADASLDSEPVACGSEQLGARLSPDGQSVFVSDWDGHDNRGDLAVGWFRTRDAHLVGSARIPGGRQVQASSDDGLLVVSTQDGTTVIDVGTGKGRTVDATLLGALHDHWIDGRTLVLQWSPRDGRATAGWIGR